MVTKGNGRRAPHDAVDAMPLKLKKKGAATQAAGSNNMSPASDASPTRENDNERSAQAYHHDWTRHRLADAETSPAASRGHGPPPSQQYHHHHHHHHMRTESEQQHQQHHHQQQWHREREDGGGGRETAQQYDEEDGDDGQTTAAPLVAIAPAKPGTMLPKDLIMAKYRVKPDAPKFLLMLYEILQHESNLVIRWTEDGLALQILDQANVTEKVLPKYFNHTNFHSFQRQLNYFGFRKWTKSKTDICTFSHPYFRRNQPELMHLIKRKKATRRVGANEQAELVYPADGFSEAGANGANSTTTSSPPMTSAGPPKKLLPLSPSGKRRLAQDASEDGESRGYPDSNGSKAPPSLPALSMHLNNNDSRSSSRSFLPLASTLTNAISPASGGAKKKAKTASGGKSFELTSSGSMPPASMLNDPAAMAAVGIPGAYPKGGLPNLDLVRNRLIYRQPPPGSAPGPMPGFQNGFPIAPNPNSQQLPSAESTSHNVSAPSQSTSNSNAPSTDSTNSMFNNSFSDPVDILLRIKKSRAMSQDNTIVQSPQHTQGQVEGFASLQNFLLSQSMYTNRLESQLKLAVEENDALRHLVDAKQREVDSLLNERKMIQNENAVLTEDKNKLFEINRDLLSKLFPQ